MTEIAKVTSLEELIADQNERFASNSWAAPVRREFERYRGISVRVPSKFFMLEVYTQQIKVHTQQEPTRWTLPDGAPDTLLTARDEQGYVIVDDENFWIFREGSRFIYESKIGKALYSAPLFITEVEPRDDLWWHFPHMSLEDPSMLAYTPNHEYGKRDRQVRVKVGRYLQKFYGGVLSAEKIRSLANRAASLEVKWADTEDEIEWVYVNGPSSCMSGGLDGFSSSRHPAVVYATPDFRLAYLENDEGITARCLVATERKEWVRHYGNDGQVLVDMLAALGYRRAGSFEGCRLQVFWEGRSYLMPYVDGDVQRVSLEGDYWVIDEIGYSATSTDGILELEDEDEDEDEDDREYCEDCEEYFHADVMRWVGLDEDRRVCDNCCDDNYTSALVSVGRFGRQYRLMHDDSTAFAEYDGETIVDSPELFEQLGIVRCAFSSELIDASEAATLSKYSSDEGDVVDRGYALFLDENEEVAVLFDDIDLDWVAQVNEDGSWTGWPLEYLLENEPELVQAWADNPEAFVRLRDVIEDLVRHDGTLAAHVASYRESWAFPVDRYGINGLLNPAEYQSRMRRLHLAAATPPTCVTPQPQFTLAA